VAGWELASETEESFPLTILYSPFLPNRQLRTLAFCHIKSAM